MINEVQLIECTMSKRRICVPWNTTTVCYILYCGDMFWPNSFGCRALI